MKITTSTTTALALSTPAKAPRSGDTERRAVTVSTTPRQRSVGKVGASYCGTVRVPRTGGAPRTVVTDKAGLPPCQLPRMMSLSPSTLSGHGQHGTTTAASKRGNRLPPGSSPSMLRPTPPVACMTPASKRRRLVAHGSGGSNTPSSSTAAGRTGGDRFIPSRAHMNLDLCRSVLFDDGSNRNGGDEIDRRDDDVDASGDADGAARASSHALLARKEYKRRMLSSLCNVPLASLDEEARPRSLLAMTGNEEANTIRHGNITAERRQRGGAVATMTAAGSDLALRPSSVHHHDILRVAQQFDTFEERECGAPRSAAAAGAEAARLLAQRAAEIPTSPYRHLEAPNMVRDFYMSLISWNANNVMAVALKNEVYLWNHATSAAMLLVEDGTRQSPVSPLVTSVAWCTEPGKAHLLAVGYDSGIVQLWDSETFQMVGRPLVGLEHRVLAMAWNGPCLTAGGFGNAIVQWDTRMRERSVVAEYRAHTKQVCALKWNSEGTALASGGNDDLVCIWDASMSGGQIRRPAVRRNLFGSSSPSARIAMGSQESLVVTPRLMLTDHTAAVKAMDWCPFRRGLLATGGGTADQTIKLWNTNSESDNLLHSTKTGSQVCSLLWSKTGNHRELVTSHGYPEGQLSVWKYASGTATNTDRPRLTKIKDISIRDAGRALNIECSPDGKSVASVSEDQSIRLWKIFDGPVQRRRAHHNNILMPNVPTFGIPPIR